MFFSFYNIEPSAVNQRGHPPIKSRHQLKDYSKQTIYISTGNQESLVLSCKIIFLLATSKWDQSALVLFSSTGYNLQRNVYNNF